MFYTLCFYCRVLHSLLFHADCTLLLFLRCSLPEPLSLYPSLSFQPLHLPGFPRPRSPAAVVSSYLHYAAFLSGPSLFQFIILLLILLAPSRPGFSFPSSSSSFILSAFSFLCYSVFVSTFISFLCPFILLFFSSPYISYSSFAYYSSFFNHSLPVLI